MIATGSEPLIPPIEGLRDLDGVWTNREVTGLNGRSRTACWCWGGGPVGVEMAQALARRETPWALVEGA